MVNMDIIKAYKRADCIGSCFEGQGTWRQFSEEQIQHAMRSTQGSDESCIVDCFLAYVKRNPWNGNMDVWLWGWLVYHQQHHGTGYGGTYRDHFSLVKYLVKEKMPVIEKLERVCKIAAEINSFGNGAIPIVYVLYQYAKANIPEFPARHVVHLFTACTHAHDDVFKAIDLLMNIIDGENYDPPSEEYIREHRCAELPTAYNTLLTAMFIAAAGTEEDVIRRGIYVAGDTDSTLATAMLLWTLKRPMCSPKNRPSAHVENSPHIPQEWVDQIFQEAREQMSGEYPSDKKE